MIRRLVAGGILLLACPGLLAGQVPSAQAGSARLVAFTNEPREPEFGEVFQLNIQVRVAPDVVAFLSDTLAEAENSVSAGPGSWTIAAGPADSIDVRATYPVMGLLPGAVELPLVELWTRPALSGETPGVRPASDLDEAALDATEFEHALLYLGGIFVMPPSEMTGDDAMLMPRPPADVLGGDRSVWLVAAIAVVGLVAAVFAWLLFAGRTPGSSSSGLLPHPSPRTEALHELDRIRGMGWHTDGRVAEFYDATTGVLRHYAERREPTQWRAALTSTELLAGLREQWGLEAVAPLGATVWTAECVKFGGREPDASAAEQDWSKVRDWIAGEGEAG
jgi:hypothetical protein